MARNTKGEWTDLQRKFIKHLAEEDCGSRREAARRAGYADPDSAVNDLMGTPYVRDAAFRVLHKKAKEKVKWRDLIDEALKVLNSAMKYGDADIAVRAASKVMDTGIKLREASLTEGAEREDIVAGSREELAQAYLGMIKKAAEAKAAPLPEAPKDEMTEVLLLMPTTEQEH